MAMDGDKTTETLESRRPSLSFEYGELDYPREMGVPGDLYAAFFSQMEGQHEVLRL